jgi:DNA-binding helix-hairpin-helix protein with protein kinase domain
MSHRPDVGDAAEALVRMGATKLQVATYLAEHLAPGEEVACPGCAVARESNIYRDGCSWCMLGGVITGGVITAKRNRKTGRTIVIVGGDLLPSIRGEHLAPANGLLPSPRRGV